MPRPSTLYFSKWDDRIVVPEIRIRIKWVKRRNRSGATMTVRFVFSPDREFSPPGESSPGACMLCVMGNGRSMGSAPDWISQPIVTPLLKRRLTQQSHPDQNVQAGRNSHTSPAYCRAVIYIRNTRRQKSRGKRQPSRSLGIMGRALGKRLFAGTVDGKSASNRGARIRQAKQVRLANTRSPEIYNADGGLGKNQW